MRDEHKENIPEGTCAQWILLSLSIQFIAKESDIPSLLLAQEQDGGW